MRAFLFKPYGDYDLEYAKDLQLETVLNYVQMPGEVLEN